MKSLTNKNPTKNRAFSNFKTGFAPGNKSRIQYVILHEVCFIL